MLFDGHGLPIGSIVVPSWDFLHRILNKNHKQELLRGLWVYPSQILHRNRRCAITVFVFASMS